MTARSLRSRAGEIGRDGAGARVLESRCGGERAVEGGAGVGESDAPRARPTRARRASARRSEASAGAAYSSRRARVRSPRTRRLRARTTVASRSCGRAETACSAAVSAAAESPRARRRRAICRCAAAARGFSSASAGRRFPRRPDRAAPRPPGPACSRRGAESGSPSPPLALPSTRRRRSARRQQQAGLQAVCVGVGRPFLISASTVAIASVRRSCCRSIAAMRIRAMRPLLVASSAAPGSARLRRRAEPVVEVGERERSFRRTATPAP